MYLQQTSKRFYAMDGICQLQQGLYALKRTAPLPRSNLYTFVAPCTTQYHQLHHMKVEGVQGLDPAYALPSTLATFMYIAAYLPGTRARFI